MLFDNPKKTDKISKVTPPHLSLSQWGGGVGSEKVYASGRKIHCQRHIAWPVLTSGRSEEAPRGHLLHSRPEGGLVLVACCKLPLQG